MRKLSQNKWLRFLFVLICIELFLQLESYISKTNNSVKEFKKDKMKIVFLGDCISYNLPRFLEKELLAKHPNLEVYDYLILHGLDELDTLNRLSFIQKTQPTLIISMLGLYEFSGQNKINQVNQRPQYWGNILRKIKLYTYLNHYFEFNKKPFENLEKINEAITLKDFTNYNELIRQLEISNIHLSEAHLRGYQLWARHLKNFSKSPLIFQERLNEEIQKITKEIDSRKNKLKDLNPDDSSELFKTKQDFEYLFWMRLSLEKYLDIDEKTQIDLIMSNALNGSLFELYYAFESLSSIQNLVLNTNKVNQYLTLLNKVLITDINNRNDGLTEKICSTEYFKNFPIGQCRITLFNLAPGLSKLISSLENLSPLDYSQKKLIVELKNKLLNLPMPELAPDLNEKSLIKKYPMIQSFYKEMISYSTKNNINVLMVQYPHFYFKELETYINISNGIHYFDSFHFFSNQENNSNKNLMSDATPFDSGRMSIESTKQLAQVLADYIISHDLLNIQKEKLK